MTRPRPALIAVVALAQVALVLAAPRSAEARKPRVRAVAQRYVRLGEELFRAERYDEAVKSFLDAEGVLVDAEKDVPAPLYRQIARCYDQMGQIVPALRYYKRFLALVDDGKPRLRRVIKEARDAEGRLQRRLEQTRLELRVTPDGTEVRIDKRSMGVTPLEPLVVAPGPHQITLWADGHEPMSVDVDVAAGATVPVVAALRVQGPAPPRGEAAGTAPEAGPEAHGDGADALPVVGSGGGSWHPWAAAGLGALAAGLGVGTWLLARAGRDLESDGDALAAMRYPEDKVAGVQAQVNAKYEDAGARKNAAVALGVGTGLAVAGAVWVGVFAGSGDARVDEAPAAGSVVPLPGGALVGVARAF